MRSMRCMVSYAFFMAGAVTVIGVFTACKQVDPPTIYQQALESALAIEDPKRRDEILHQLAPAQARATDGQGAQRTLTHIQGAEARMKALFDVARVLVKQGDLRSVLAMIEPLDPSPQRNEVLFAVVKAQAKAGDIENASRTALGIQAEGIQEDDIQQEGYGRRLNRIIASAQVKAGKAKAALESTAGIGDVEHRGHILRVIAEAQAEAGDVKGALQTVTLIQNPKVRDHARKDVALAQARARDGVGALQTIALIQDQFIREVAPEAVALAQAEVRDGLGALQTVGTIKDTRTREYHIYWIARTQSESDDPEGALAWARTLPAPYDRAAALMGIGGGIRQAQTKCTCCPVCPVRDPHYLPVDWDR